MASVLIGGEDRWELGEVIGSGGAGQVRLATCGTYEPHVIKLVPKEDGALRELTITRNLDVPNVVPVLGTGRTDTHLALLMPKADRSLRDHIKAAGGPLPEAEALAILCDIARALAGLVQARTADGGTGIVHRDLKPENVLYLDGAWSLSDFGIARHADRATETHTRRYGMTPHYAAPEQLRGETATASTDVYAFGVIAFELLMGSRPFGGPDVRQQHLIAEVPPMPTVSPTLASIVVECLYKHAGTRPSPDRLVKRLQDETHRAARSITGGVSALQSANLAATSQLGRESWVGHENHESDGQRAALFRIAMDQWSQISALLKDVILEHAPTCRPAVVGDAGWQLQLNRASLVLSEPTEQQSERELQAFSFDVIAYCYIAVGTYLEDDPHVATPLPEEEGLDGGAHSLWFCDAQTRGQFAWHEVAFSGRHSMETSFDRRILGINGYFWVNHPDTSTNYTVPGRYLPIAATPVRAAQDAELDQSRGPTYYDGGNFKVAWPFTALLLGDLEEFLDRWITWFADASLGKRPDLSAAPRVGVGRQAGGRQPLGVTARPQRSERSASVDEGAPSGEVANVLQEISYAAGEAYDDTAHAIAVAPHLSSDELQQIARELHSRLSVQAFPSLVFKHLSDKKYRPPAAVGGPAGWLIAHFLPLRFLDGTRYEEFAFASNADPRIIMVERREPSRGGQYGRLLAAFVVVVAEQEGLLRNGGPSRSLRQWFDQPEGIVRRA